MRPLTFTVAVTAVLVAAGTSAYLGPRYVGLTAQGTPGRLETAVAQRILALSIPQAAALAPNPFEEDRDAWREAAPRFDAQCATCHGADGRGGLERSPRMYPPVPDLGSQPVQRLSDGAIFWIIQNGVRWTGMPAFSGAQTSEQTWRLVSFIRHVPSQAAGTQTDRPDLSATRTGADGKTVRMEGTAFAPARIEVHVGDTVTWSNQDPFPHDVTAASGSFHTTLQPDQQWQFQTLSPGRIEYLCTLHPGMKGVLVVEP